MKKRLLILMTVTGMIILLGGLLTYGLGVHEIIPVPRPDLIVVGTYRTELLEIPVCIGVPGISNHGVRGNLLCFGTEYRHGRKYLRRDMGLHGLHGPAVLRPVQDRQPL